MSDLIIDRYIINEPIINILRTVKSQLVNGKLRVIQNKPENCVVSCPNHNHKHGLENNASCFVYCGNSPDIEYGTVHCFTCDFKGPLWHFIGECFDRGDDYGKKWLIENFGEEIGDTLPDLPEIVLNNTPEEKFLDDSVLHSFESYHPYIESRRINKDTCERFEVKYDPETSCVVFPVRDECGRLRFLTRRSVLDKKFIIDKGSDKSSIYLLYNVLKEKSKVCYVVESQFNALTLWQWGYPAIALFGSGTSESQMARLNKTPIMRYILCYDNDPAGLKGEKRFKNLIRKDVFVDTLTMPIGKDVNDITKEEFDFLMENNLSKSSL